jgi:hypothetical protein
MDRHKFDFYKSSESFLMVLRAYLLKHEDQRSDEDKQGCCGCGWCSDASIWRVIFDKVFNIFLRSHPSLSVWFHHPEDPYSGQQRLSVMAVCVLTSLAINAICFSPENQRSFESDLSISIYSSIFVSILTVGLTNLFVRVSSTRSRSNALVPLNDSQNDDSTGCCGCPKLLIVANVFLTFWALGSIFICLTYALRFDVQGGNVSYRWARSCALSFLQGQLLNNPLYILVKTVVFTYIARWQLEREARQAKDGLHSSDQPDSQSDADLKIRRPAAVELATYFDQSQI